MWLFILYAYLTCGGIFAAYIAYAEDKPTDLTDCVALALVIVLAFILWPWFAAVAVLDLLERDKPKDKDIMKMF